LERLFEYGFLNIYANIHFLCMKLMLALVHTGADLGVGRRGRAPPPFKICIFFKLGKKTFAYGLEGFLSGRSFPAHPFFDSWIRPWHTVENG
jgi:hypothetical protein